ncbi:MAG: hypothetical protein LBG95_02995 [Treponema sp.]|jgi:hypothetical protein|nr:hypothetical protein [Treponema sp.]
MIKKKLLFALFAAGISALALMQTAQCKSSPVETPAEEIPGAVPPSYASIVPAGYFNAWKPGIPGGIPSVENIHSTINAADFDNGGKDAARAINDAIKAAGKEASADRRQVVLLTAGTFKTGNTIVMDQSNVVLRGAGKSTVLQGVNGGSGAITIGWEWPGGFTRAIAVHGSPKAGDAGIVVANASGIKAGDILILDRLADDNGHPFGGKGPASPWRSGQVGGSEWRKEQQYFIRGPGASNVGPSSSVYRPVKQYIEVSRVEGNILFLSNQLNIDFPFHLSPQVYKTNAEKYQYIGLENMKLEIVAGGGDPGNQWEYNPPSVNMSIGSSYCWVKNIESDGTTMRGGKGFKGRHITIQGFRNVVTGNYVHDSYDNRPGGNGYGIEIHGTDGLIDNNIVDLLCKPILGYASGGGNVISYNYVPNTETGPSNGGRPANGRDPSSLIDWQETAIDMSHASYSHSDLYEGNYAANISTDNTSGNNGQMVVFRNHGAGRNLNGQTRANLMALQICAWNNDHASIGNVWLAPGFAPGTRLWDVPGAPSGSNPSVYNIGKFAWDRVTGQGQNWDFYEGLERGWAFSKFFRHLDFDLVSDKVFENPDSKVSILPPSLYLAAAPDYFAGYKWPPVDPLGATHEARVGRLPAQDRYPK